MPEFEFGVVPFAYSWGLRDSAAVQQSGFPGGRKVPGVVSHGDFCWVRCNGVQFACGIRRRRNSLR
ncbi:MAG: hypothetical protein ACKPHU_16915, partial [Planctomycetaceae bacterium]